MKISGKFPNVKQVTQVFAVASIMIYGWTTYRFIEKLPGWLYYLEIQEILSNYSYALVFDFLEALLFIGFILIVNLFLPENLFKWLFVARGTFFAIFGFSYLIYLARAIGESKASQFPEDLVKWAPLVLITILSSTLFLPRVVMIRRIMEDFAERAVIFLYVLLPLTGVGLLLFLFNNLF